MKLSPAERDFILSYYEMKIPNATCLAQRYGITRQAADKRLKKIEEKIKKLVAISKKVAVASEREILSLAP